MVVIEVEVAVRRSELAFTGSDGFLRIVLGFPFSIVVFY